MLMVIRYSSALNYIRCRLGNSQDDTSFYQLVLSKSEDSWVELLTAHLWVYITGMSHPIHHTDIWAAIAWWSQFPELSKLWATGNHWLHSVMAVAPELKVKGYCEPLLFNFTRLVTLNLSCDANLDLTSLPQPLPSTIRSLVVHLSRTPVRPLEVSDFPPQLTELTLHIATGMDPTLLPKTLTSLTIVRQRSGVLTFRASFMTELVRELPDLRSLILPDPPLSLTLDWPTILPTGLTRLKTPFQATSSDLRDIPSTTTELNIDWRTHHIPFIPTSLTCLSLSYGIILTQDNVGLLSIAITELNVAYYGLDLSCFERLPLRKWVLHLKSNIDFQCNLPQLRHLEVTNANTVYVPSSVHVLLLHNHHEVIFPQELRIREFLGLGIDDAKAAKHGQLSQCTNYQIPLMIMAPLAAVKIQLHMLSAVYLSRLIISISDTIPLPELLNELSTFINLTELWVIQIKCGSKHSDMIQTHAGCPKLPPVLSTFYLEGDYHLPDLELPVSITKLNLRDVKIPHSVLAPLFNLCWLSISFPLSSHWPTNIIREFLESLPKRMVHIKLEAQMYPRDTSSHKDYIAARSRYLQHLETY